MNSKHLFYAVTFIYTCILFGHEAVNEESFRFPSKDDTNRVQKNVNDFGYKLLLKMMNKNKDQNIVISPTGVAGVLAMALLGSVGRTYGEIALALGFSQDVSMNREIHEELGKLLKSLSANTLSNTVYSNTIFVDMNTPIRQLYRDYIHDVFRGDLMAIDFTQSENAKNRINSWVMNHTGGYINDFLKSPLPPFTQVVLLSALYFTGQWKQPFVPEYTKKMAFKRMYNSEVMADLMLNFGSYRYTFDRDHDLHMIALPYNDSETVLYALKPRLPNKISLLELMEKINYENIENIINQMKTQECLVRFPKMEINVEANLENTLKSMGITSMFTAGEANFALMVDDTNKVVNNTDGNVIKHLKDVTSSRGNSVRDILGNMKNPGIHVDALLHDVKISINEYGTTAAAATGAILARTAEQFYADSPFYMFIRNERTKLVTFSAVIFDPTI